MVSGETAGLVGQFVLSREELLLILNLLGTGYSFGLETEPLGEISAEQKAFSLVCAERALRARGLARLDEDRHLKVQAGLLKAVAVCGYAARSLLVHYFGAQGQARRLFGHVHADGITGHNL